jgi:acetolactate synthase-1/3 small subunit
MAMRRGHHTSRVLKALGTHAKLNPSDFPTHDPDAHPNEEDLPTEFDEED